jgi:hypothetical protein
MGIRVTAIRAGESEVLGRGLAVACMNVAINRLKWKTKWPYYNLN